MAVAAATFALFAASQVGTPGPANMALMATGARYGLRKAMPFVAGVALGKQLVIWPVGYGLMSLFEAAPVVLDILKWVSAAYILWLAWRVAHLQLAPGEAADRAPGFLAGLVVHPLNPKAWAMIVAGFSGFVSPGTPVFEATLTIAAILLACQLVLHPLWCFAGDRIALMVAGRPAEAYLMRTLAALTVLSVLFVVFGGGTRL
jgi:threonine/homoserine/homoserine lactone efflux protein